MSKVITTETKAEHYWAIAANVAEYLTWLLAGKKGREKELGPRAIVAIERLLVSAISMVDKRFKNPPNMMSHQAFGVVTQVIEELPDLPDGCQETLRKEMRAHLRLVRNLRKGKALDKKATQKLHQFVARLEQTAEKERSNRLWQIM